jgi:asparagine synthase (glutamine-hydrolysing)
LFTVAMDAGRMDRSSVWRVLWATLREVITGARWSPLDEVGQYRHLIRAEVLEETRKTERFTHPWFRSVDPSVPGGKIWHAYQLIHPLEFYHPLQRASDPDLLTPLFAQPMFELVLRIATHLHIELGWDRAVARRASVPDIPLEITLRQAKGSQDDYVRNILLRDLAFARELLLDGRLVKERIVHRRKLEDALSPHALRVQATTSEIYDCLSTEIWLQALAGAARSRRLN